MQPPIDPREDSIYWPANLDANGIGTFLLPGETSIDSATMRRRTAAYYRQVRGNPAAALSTAKNLRTVRALLTDLRAESAEQSALRRQFEKSSYPIDNE
jgi:hypothetical protein